MLKLVTRHLAARVFALYFVLAEILLMACNLYFMRTRPALAQLISTYLVVRPTQNLTFPFALAKKFCLNALWLLATVVHPYRPSL